VSTPERARYVIVGGGLAGAKTAEGLRERDADAEIVLIGDETELPYERPALSKAYLKGDSPFAETVVHDADWYAEQRIDLRSGTTVTSIDRSARTVTTDAGETLDYSALVLATGSRPRVPPIAGADPGSAAGLLYLRRHADSDRIKDVLATAKHLVVIGSGWIGLEVSAAARDAGLAVTVLTTSTLPLVNVLGPEVAQVFADLHTAHGVEFQYGAQIAAVTSEAGVVTGVQLADGTTVPGDAVLVAVGALPNSELAAAAGLEVDHGGVQVDAGLRTSDPGIWAVGDIAAEDHPVLPGRIRIEHWANALNQPAAAAAAITGERTSYDKLPYFYTDQYDLGMEYIGYVGPTGYDEVVFRGDVPGREFIVFWLKGGKVLAGMNVNVWDVVDDITSLILADRAVDTAVLADPSVPLAQVPAADAAG
jgi:3-phenylpropionate/trans-cinnamate dioxygenase ferredoxin reductase component